MRTQVSAEELQMEAREAQIKKAIDLLENAEERLSRYVLGNMWLIDLTVAKQRVKEAVSVLRGEK